MNGDAVDVASLAADRQPAIRIGSSSPALQVFRCLGGDAVRWRLISANGRELGRSAESFAGHEQATAQISLVSQTCRAGSIRVVGVGDRAWEWELVVDGEVVVKASHAFDRRIRCEQAASLFLQLVGEAELRPGVMEPVGRRTQRAAAARRRAIALDLHEDAAHAVIEACG